MRITKKNIIDVDKIKMYMAKNHIPRYKFAKMCHITKNTLENILSNKHSFQLRSLLDVCAVMQVPVREIFLKKD